MGKWQLGGDPTWHKKDKHDRAEKDRGRVLSKSSAGREGDEVRAKKQLGQHFLNDPKAAAEIVAALRGDNQGSVVEIGPGMGVITRGLLARFGERLHCLELDRESIGYLECHLPELGERLHCVDCLRFDFATLPNPVKAMVGNLPYNISSQILFMVLEHRDSVKECVFMLQREVATRIAAHPGSRAYGILSVLLQAYYDISLILSLPPEAFSPPPKVHSSVIYMRRNTVQKLACNEVLFKQIVKGAFNQRRKTLRNSLGACIPYLKVDALPFESLRPEALSVAQFVEITNAVEGMKG